MQGVALALLSLFPFASFSLFSLSLPSFFSSLQLIVFQTSPRLRLHTRPLFFFLDSLCLRARSKTRTEAHGRGDVPCLSTKASTIKEGEVYPELIFVFASPSAHVAALAQAMAEVGLSEVPDQDGGSDNVGEPIQPPLCCFQRLF